MYEKEKWKNGNEKKDKENELSWTCSKLLSLEEEEDEQENKKASTLRTLQFWMAFFW